MVTEFRKMKLFHLFYSFFDTNSSGVVDKKDFELAADNISHLRGWKEDDPKNKETKEELLKIWYSLQNQADKDGDGKVTVEEWLEMWETFAKNSSNAFEWQKLYCRFVFNLEDASGDGVIDYDEFSTVFQSFGLSKDDTKAAFQKMAKGKTTISWEEFQELWKEYFTSDDPKDPGNCIFGAATF